MAEVIGPCSTLPGRHHQLPDGAKCDQHPDRLAVARVQGETDSFGAELNDMCQECLDAEREYAQSPEATSGTCEWCKNHATDLRNRRDWEEGSAGRVYRVCGACVARENEEIAAQMDDYDDWDDSEDEDDYDDCGMGQDGQCSQAGTEWCDWVCKHGRGQP